MARLKYGPGVLPFVNEHHGYTYLRSGTGQSALSSQKNDRNRNRRQINKKYNLMQCTNIWRNLSAETKTAWNLYASTYPQSCKNQNSGFLSGYQLFLKRQHYLFLNYGITERPMIPPLEEPLPSFNFSVSVNQIDNCVDVSDAYIANFGLIPKPGSFLILKVLPIAIETGQFFEPISNTVEVIESYIDGLFISFQLPVDIPRVVFQIYLSKPVHESERYVGTKVRYMGCFTTKTFLQLTDTPDSYGGQAGKIVSVKPDESGLEFIPVPTPIATVQSEMSVVGDGSAASKLKLKNDINLPGNMKYYGTSSNGTKGWLAIPAAYDGPIFDRSDSQDIDFNAVGINLNFTPTWSRVQREVVCTIWDTTHDTKETLRIFLTYRSATNYYLSTIRENTVTVISSILVNNGYLQIALSELIHGSIWFTVIRWENFL